MQFSDTLTNLIKLNLDQNLVPALLGEPGIGKSSFVEALAAEMDTEAFVLPCNQLAERADLTGARLVPTADGSSYQQMFFPHHVVVECIEYAKAHPTETPILFLDEINRTGADVTSAALTLVTLRRLGHERLPDNARIMVAGNDKGNVTALDEASLSRFCLYRVEPDAPGLLSHLDTKCNKWVRKVLSLHPTLVFARSTPTVVAADGPDDDDDGATTAAVTDMFDAGEEMLQLTTPRTIENLSRYLEAADPTDLASYLATPAKIGERTTTLLNEVIEAHVGNTPFATHIVGAIAEDLATNPVAAAPTRVSVPRPACYGGLKAAGSVSQLETLIDQLTDRDRTAALLYAVYERQDNARLIRQLALASELDLDERRTLATMVTSQQADPQNVQALANATGPAADQARPVLSALVEV